MTLYSKKGLPFLILIFLSANTVLASTLLNNQTLPSAESESAISRVAQDSISDEKVGEQIRYIQPFKINSDIVVTSPDLRAFSAEVDSIMIADTITHVSVVGLASIDGPVALNNRLAKARAGAMTKWLQQTTSIPGDIISTSSRGEDWQLFRDLVEKDSKIPARDEVMRILASKLSDTAKEGGIKGLDNGRTWKYLAENIFPVMRCAEVTLDVKHRFIIPIPEDIIETEEVVEVEETPVEILSEVEEVVAETLMEVAPEEWRRRFYIKTDLPYWAMLWTNVAFEVDIASHWSFNLPVYYSAFNYFKHTLKFRVFGFQPGVRYWFKPNNMGAYLEAHYGMAWYDFAFDGKYRYQDYYRKTPLVGGGLAAGYRLPITKNGRWMMEFGGGVGVYRLHYNRFINEYNGKLVDSKKKTYFGLDNVNVSISYTFPIEKKKGGEK